MATSPSGRRRGTAQEKAVAPDQGGDVSSYDASTATSRAMQAILIRIRELRLEPGQAFTESELAAELDTGKTPVREALLVLGAEGFVFPRPRSGYRVSPITVKATRDLFILFRALAGEAAALAAGHRLETVSLLRLEDLDLGIVPVTEEDLKELVSTQVDFYIGLGSASGSRRVLIQLMWLLNDFARLLYLTFRGGGSFRLPAGQSEVVAALKAHDPEAARTAARRLLDAWEEVLVSALLESDALQDVNLAAPHHPVEPTERPRRGAAATAKANGSAPRKPAAKATAAKKPAKKAPRR